MVGSPSSRAGNCRKALTKGREWSGSNPRGPGVVGRPSQRAKSGHEVVTEGWEAFPDGREWSGDSPEGPRVVERPSQTASSGW